MSPKMFFSTVPLSELQSKGVVTTERAKPLVLIVDDEAIIADTLAVILKQDGFAARVAYDGLSALEVAKSACPDLLLTDVVMPGMSGVELALKLRQDLPNCKILLFSGQASTMDLLSNAGNAGHDLTVISKPIHPKDLLARVSQALEFAAAS